MLCLIVTLVAAPFETSWAADGGIAAAALAAGTLVSLVPVDEESRWESELLPFDESVKANMSMRAARLADGLVAVTVTAPLVAQASGGFNEELGERALIYGETLAVTFALNNAAKHLVQRPRPYTYNPSDEARAHVREEGKDSRLSFYSGHAATAFAAAVAGSYLYAAESDQVRSRAALWGVELALATATASFRVRAGKHFYSDVIAGAVLGAGAGWLIPRLHESGEAYAPRPLELYAMAGGVLVGALGSQVVPLESHVSVVPLALERGAGVGLIGSF
jgi:membrane-associated phospholipid phosphatase